MRRRTIAFYVTESEFKRVFDAAKQEYISVAAFCRAASMRQAEKARTRRKRRKILNVETQEARRGTDRASNAMPRP
jgi:hypothetical protein